MPAVVQSATTNSGTGVSFTVSLSSVAAADSLLLVVQAGSGSVSAVAATGYTWTRISGTGTVAAIADVEFWQGVGGSGGAVTATVTLTTSGVVSGGTLFEISGGATAVGGSGSFGTSTSVGLNAQTVTSSNSLVFGAFNTTRNQGPHESSAPGSPWTAIAGPLFSGVQLGGIVYQQTSSNTLATAWTLSGSNPYVVAAVVVPPNSTNVTAGLATATAQAPDPENKANAGIATVTAAAFGPTNFVRAGSASVSATAYVAIGSLVTLAHPTIANATATALGPTNFANVGVAFAYALAFSPTSFALAGTASVTAAAYTPTYSTVANATVASVTATAYSTASGSISSSPITANATAAAYLVAQPPLVTMPTVFLEVAFNNNIFDPLSSMVWTNITQYMDKDATITYGRAHNLDGTSAATLEVTLNDRDGRFTPYNVSSPYYGNGQSTGLIPSKPVRLYAQYNNVNYPVFYGYVSSWTPSVLDASNQDAVLRATDLLGILGKAYLANTTIYPNLVATSNPIAEFRLGDFANSYNGTTTQALADYTDLGGSASVVVPNLPAASVAALSTPFYLGGQTGQFLYDINTQIELGDSSTAQNAISQNQQNIENAQQQLQSDETTYSNDLTQLGEDQAYLANDTLSAQNTTNSAISDASEAYAAAGRVATDCGTSSTGLVGLCTSIHNQAVSDGHANTINSAAFTLAIANGAYSIALTADSSAANVIGAISTVNSSPTAANTANLINVVNIATANGNNAANWVGDVLTCIQATQAQANTDGDTNTANSANFAAAYAQDAQSDVQNAIYQLQFVYSDAQNISQAWQTVTNDQNQITQDQTAVNNDIAAIAADNAAITAGSVAAQTAVADTSAYITATPGSGSIYGGVGWFTTTSLPVPTYLNQVIATISQPTGGTATSIQVNANGYVTLNYGLTAEVTSASVINAAGNVTSTVTDGNVHMIAWGLNGTTMSLYLDGILQGSFTHSGLNPGIQASPHNKIAIGGSPLLSGVLQGDFIGTVQDFAFFSTPPTAAAIAALYVLGSKFQHVETTASRCNDALLIGLGQTAYNNIPNAVMGNSLCFAEVNQTIQTTALSYIGQVAETENGFFFQNAGASVVQLPINWVQTNPTSVTPQAVFADNTSTIYHYGADNFQFPLDDDDLYSTIQIMQSTGTTSITDTGTPTELNDLGQFIEVTNASSASVFGPRTLQQSGILLENQSDMYFLANLLLARYAFPIPRVQSVQLSSVVANNLSQMLGRQLWDQVTVQRQGPGETSFSQNSVIEQITHKIDVTKPLWTTVFCLSPFELIYPG